jgi:hypothetical protein
MMHAPQTVLPFSEMDDLMSAHDEPECHGYEDNRIRHD